MRKGGDGEKKTYKAIFFHHQPKKGVIQKYQAAVSRNMSSLNPCYTSISDTETYFQERRTQMQKNILRSVLAIFFLKSFAIAGTASAAVVFDDVIVVS